MYFCLKIELKMKGKLFLLLFLSFCFSYSQEVKIKQNAQIKELMEVKKEFAQLEKTYQIQIFAGNITDANAELKKSSTKTKLPVSMVFETPNYKVRIGKFRTRLEAEKAQNKLKSEYPSSFIIDPY